MPLGGLGNRMRSMASAYALARRLQYRLEVLWLPSRNMYCKFSDLFLQPQNTTIIEGGFRLKLQNLMLCVFAYMCRKYPNTRKLCNKLYTAFGPYDRVTTFDGIHPPYVV